MDLMTAAFFLFLLFGNSYGMNILVNSKKCPSAYENGYIFQDTKINYDGAVKLCDSENGKLPLPTDKNWEETLKYLRDKQSRSNHPEEGDWIGMTFVINSDSKILAHDSDGMVLTPKQRKLIPITDEYIQVNLLSAKRGCVVYFPPDSTHSDWYFDLQSCGGNGVSPPGRAVCKCISDIQKEVPPVLKKADVDNQSDPELAQSEAQTETNDSTSLQPKGRAGPGPARNIPGVDENNDSSGGAGDSTTPLVIMIGVLFACCLLGTAYYVMKRQGWNVRRMVSDRMPYNRPRPSLNGGTIYLRGHESSEISSNSRPIHVYEEIIPRNRSGAFLASSAQRRAITSSSSSVTMPHLPPPDPPVGYLPEHLPEQFIEHACNSREDGYMQPSFRRKDTIPGDVRSPPPIQDNVFTFPLAKPIPKMNTLQVPDEKELKYASVETVQTLLDDENGDRDEEYLVDENDSGVNVSTESREENLVVELPKKCSSGSNDQTLATNSYVHITENPPPVRDVAGFEAISPVFACSNDYENERFLTTVMKVPPVKPKRKNKNSPPMLEPQKPTSSDSVIYARIPSISKEPVYSQVKRKENRTQPTERHSGAYTPMRSDTLKRESTPLPSENSIDQSPTPAEQNVQEKHEGALHLPLVKMAPRRKNFISSPSMISTTNKALENSSLVCYEIPPEEDDYP
uniref:uncharacterized protein LOC120347432 n=1 Tax=Styela clava TaxID=7725 RepID=UPI00193A2B68|nr:uncharacterized protein LOC120347432 [Styela clava]XP_039273331.1 uncharacterized protein LOC120347432 [Styela clava]